MIRIDRDQVPKPEDLDRRTHAARSEMREFYERGKAYKGQRSFKVAPIHIPIVRAPLLALSHGKCAYCESVIQPVAELQIDRYRPLRGALNLNKRESPDHYWWLAYEWENLYPCCPDCNRHKGQWFPVKGPRAEPEATGAALESEHRLLLDPCRDDPAQSLRFNPDGTVVGVDERGRVTIKVLGLNRQGLVAARKAVAATIRRQLEFLDGVSEVPAGVRSKGESTRVTKLRMELTAQLDDANSYAALRRQLIAPILERGDARALPRKKRPSRAGETSAAAEDVLRQATSLSTWIEQVEIHNFRAISETALTFPSPSGESDPWIMLLGENGVGKSSALKAVALAFMDAKARRRYMPDARTCVTKRAKSGLVRIHFNNQEPITLRFRHDSTGFALEGRPPVMPLLAYGSTRLPPPPDRRDLAGPQRVRVGNLFDPREPLSDAEPWLADTDRVDADTFSAFARSLRILIALEDDAQITRLRGRLRIHQEGSPIALREHSDGYQSIVALATDILLNLATDWHSMESAEGTVLLDELEAHLHPKWKIEIVDRLRQVFPRVRFIATTHDPLCLQGTRSGEVHRMYRALDGGAVHVDQIDVPAGLRADQLLTGEWFGLSTTIDKDTRMLLEQHGQLLRGRKTVESERRREGIENTLRQRLGGFGETAIERLAWGAATEIMDEEHRELTPRDRETLREKVLKHVRAAKRQDAATTER